jgi:hypothetical protein
MKSLYLSIFLFLAYPCMGQQAITGRITDNDSIPLVGATVQWLGTSTGTTTNENGYFSINPVENHDHLLINYIGFLSDTVSATTSPLTIVMQENTAELNEVIVEGDAVFIDTFEPKLTEVITEKELTKAACCNLSESFETNASVDVSFTDAVTGAKQIRMLGLDGRYVQINRENIPHIRGLNNRYGLNFVPGTWIQSINVGKGAGTVVNGYESMTGQLNLEFKKPEAGEKLYLNAYVNSFGRVEANANTRYDLNEHWSGTLILHADYFKVEIDRNDDGFMDLPKARQINILNRYKYTSERLISQIGIHALYDQKAGGQNGFDFGDDFRSSPEYGISNETTRFEIFGKTGLLFPSKPYKGWGFIYSASRYELDGGYGRNNYNGTQSNLYGNIIYQNKLGSTIHQYKTGASILFDDFKENFADSAFSRQEVVPGAYYEYSYIPNDKFTLVAGVRTDFHNLYGTYLTPRVHLRKQMGPSTTLRVSAGRGYRTPNVILENSQVLVSSREISIDNDITPEIAWNFGGSLVRQIRIGEQVVDIVADYFYTRFENQVIYDMDASSDALFIYNLNGESYAHSFQVEASVPLFRNTNAKVAYKYYDVRATINEELQRVPFVSRDRFFVNVSYASRFDKWTGDLTVQWYGRKRLPNTQDKPEIFQRPDFSPDFALVNMQVSRGFRWGSIYLGSENLLNFMQDNPIIDPGNPFGEQFDASIVWGPIAGRLIYTGIRYKIKN